MANEKCKKRCFVKISSSKESKSSLPESYDDTVEEISSSISCNGDEEEEDDDDGSDWDHSEDETENGAHVDEDEDCDDDDVDKVDAESMCNKVIQFIRGGSDLQELKLNECKAYLRRHKLRLSGTKEECIQRIKELWKLKDGNGEVFYPRSSFIIDCTGDVCRGDVVLFHQKVYQISGKMTRSRRLQRRTVAGRIVKESYGAAKQQHTFTVEVLWSRGSKKLDPLFPLLVKGRNLYKLKTFRQLWKNEKERLKVLSEKHRRGDAARTIRAMRKTNKSLTNKGAKHHHHLGSSRTRETTNVKKNCLNDHEALSKSKKRICSQTSSLRSKQNGGFRGFIPSQTFYNIRSNVFPTELHYSHSHGGSASTSRSSYSHPLPYSTMKPILEWNEFSHGPGYSHSKNRNEARSFNRFPRLMNNRSSFYSTPDAHRCRYYD